MSGTVAWWLPTRRAMGSLLLLAGSALLVAGIATGTRPSNLTYGLSRVDGDPGIAIHWALCADEAARVVDVEGYWGGSQLPTAVAVFWQIRSGAEPPSRPRVETYVVGQTPPGFYQTVSLRRQLPDDRIAISGPPGDASAQQGMSFKPAELRRHAVYRGDYEFVSPEKFASDGIAHCGGVNAGVVGFGLVGLGLGAGLLAGRARPTILFIALLAALTGFVAVATLLIDMPQIGQPAQERAVFRAGSASVPDDREVLLDISPATHQARPGGIFVARILAPGPYAFIVGCEGASIHVGESSEIENGGTGGRQLIGCSTARPVRGTIADRSDRADIVEIVVDPNGMADWRVVVVNGAGEVGPFDEP